jgi:uncharacterized membrane protein
LFTISNIFAPHDRGRICRDNLEARGVWDSVFLNRLRKELPGWTAQGWVTAAGEAAILEQATARTRGGLRLVPTALAVMGALTFGAGVITFFAANWEAMSKIAKLLVLLGGMWGAYALAARWLAAEAAGTRALGQATTLLGVILFGANIMLIAQIYHIDSHYPNGVLTWALGALALTYAVSVQVVAVAGLALAVLWSGMEIFAFGSAIHWPFPVVWALFLPPILRHTWRYGGSAAMLALLLWCLMTLFSWPYDARGEEIFLIQVYVLAGMAFYVLGAAMEGVPAVAGLSAIVRRFALVGVLLSAHMLVYDDLYGVRRLQPSGTNYGIERLASAPGPWIAATLVALALAAGLAVWHLRRRGDGRVDGLAKSGLALLAAAGGLMLINLVLPASYNTVTLLYIAMNLVVFAGIVWLIVAGYRSGDRFQVNTAFVFFALGMLALYFNYFWTLMDRSLFFMGGGALLLAGGFLLERQRRRLVGRIAGPPGGAS